MKRAALLLALLLALLVAVSTARADVAPPVGKGKKLVPVAAVVEVPDSFPDCAFFELSWSSAPGPPPHGDSSR
jgi:hypothetical protein